MQTTFNCIKKQLYRSLLLCCVVSSAWGTVEVPLYEIELPLQNVHSTFDQVKLTEEAFKAVLIRVSGSEKILQNNQVQKDFNEIEKYVSKVSFHQLKTTERSIRIFFNESLINQLLNTAKQSVWEKRRPLTLIWLVAESDNTLTWVGVEPENKVEQELKTVLARRGIPFLLPLWDLTDLTQVSEKDVLNNITEPLEQAAKRYHPDTVLVGRISHKSGVWLGYWTLLKEGQKISWENSAKALNPLLNTVAEDLSKRLMGRPLIAEESPLQHLTLTVSGIVDAGQYVKVLAHLQQLPLVSEVEIAQVMPEKTVFHLKAYTNRESIVKSIAEGNLLVENNVLDAEAPEIMDYKVVEAS